MWIVVVACCYFGFDPSWGYCSGSPWWTHFTFQFAHGNVFHLAANMLVVMVLASRNDALWIWPVSFAISSLCSLFVSTPNPTVGLSGMLFAFYGIIFLKYGPQWKPLLQTCVFMVVSCFFVSRMAVGLHFMSLFGGCMVGGLIGVANELKRKERMYDDR